MKGRQAINVKFNMTTPAAGNSSPSQKKSGSNGASTVSSDGASNANTSESSAGGTKEAKDGTTDISKVAGGQIFKEIFNMSFNVF